MRRVLIPHNLQQLPAELPAGELNILRGQSMGTTWTVQLVNSPQLPDIVLRKLIEDELNLVIAQMSIWKEDSNISLFNRAEAGTWHHLPDAFFSVLDCALDIAAETDGAFDPTIGALVNLWGFGPSGNRNSPPEIADIAALHAHSGWQKLQLDKSGNRVFQPGKLVLDFSGIAKGYSVDKIARALKSAGIDSYLVEIGGELYGAGIKPDGQPWWVELECSPVVKSTQLTLALHALAVATSGDYRRYFEHAGKYYAHTLDPRTGFPIDRATNALVSVSVIHADCMVADALATAFTVMGVEAALAYATKNDIAALLVEQKTDGVVEHLSPKLMAMLE